MAQGVPDLQVDVAVQLVQLRGRDARAHPGRARGVDPRHRLRHQVRAAGGGGGHGPRWRRVEAATSN